MHKLLKQAFTLIELLVVIAIIGILSGLIIVGMNGMTQKATIAKAQVFSNSLRNSLMMNIVGEWKFDGTATDGTASTNADVLDTWGGVNNGSVTVPVRTHTPTIRRGSNCISGSCLEFNGIDDYVTASDTNLPSGTAQRTMSVWVKCTSVPNSDRNILAYGKGGTSFQASVIYVQGTTGKAGFSNWSNEGAMSASSVCDNNWHFITTTLGDSGIMKIYVDNLSPVTITQSMDTVLMGSVNIGRNNNGQGGYFPGSIDDVRIYNAAMPTSQIKEQYYSGLTKLLANGGITKKEYRNRIGELAVGL